VKKIALNRAREMQRKMVFFLGRPAALFTTPAVFAKGIGFMQNFQDFFIK
jgi:hypothetical protein